MATSINILKGWFTTGKFPTQTQFWAWLDSFRHKDESVPVNEIEGLNELLDLKADAELISNHTNDIDAHSNLFENKVDKVPGKGLSTNDFTTEEKDKLAALDENVTLLDATGDATFTKQVVAKPDGTLGVEDKYGVTSAWTNLTLQNGATANKARYRVKGDTVEIELYILRINSSFYSQFLTLPSNIAPTGLNDSFFCTGYNISTSLPVLISISANGQMRTITNTNTDGLALTIQYKRF